MRWMIGLAAIAACGRNPSGAPARPVSSAPIEVEPVPPDPRGRDGVHGMIVFGGGDELFASHVPMTHAPHDVQLVMRVTLRAVEGAAPARLDELYTIAPERFRLDDVLAGERTSFRAELYRGNFEDGGARIATVDVSISERLISHAIGSGPDDEYYVVGSAPPWAIHRVGTEAAYDAIAAIEVAAPIAPGRYRVARRLAAGDALVGADGTHVATGVRELSCLVGPEFMRPCPPR